MKLPQFAERMIVRAILSKAGPAVQKAITLGVAAAIAALSKQLPGIEQHVTPEVLTGILWLVIDSLVTRIPADIIKRYGREVQEFYNVVKPASKPPLKLDGFIGPVSTKAVKQGLVA